jgi:hypothetical protein
MCGVVMLCCPNMCCELCVCSAPSHRLSGGGHSVASVPWPKGRKVGGIVHGPDAVFSLHASPAASAPTTGVPAMSHPVVWVRLGC